MFDDEEFCNYENDIDDYDDEYTFGPDDDQDDIMRLIDKYVDDAKVSNTNSVEINYWFGAIERVLKNKQWQEALDISPKENEIECSFLWNSSEGLCSLSFCILNLYQNLPSPNKRNLMQKITAGNLERYFEKCIERSILLDENERNVSVKAYWKYYNALINQVKEDSLTALKIYGHLINITKPAKVSYQNEYRYLRSREETLQKKVKVVKHVTYAWRRILDAYRDLIERFDSIPLQQDPQAKLYYRKALYHFSKISILHLLYYNSASRNLLVKLENKGQVLKGYYYGCERHDLLNETALNMRKCYELTNSDCTIDSIEHNKPHFLDVTYRRSQIVL